MASVNGVAFNWNPNRCVTGMLTDSNEFSLVAARRWRRANLMPRADRDRYGGSVTTIPATPPLCVIPDTLHSPTLLPLKAPTSPNLLPRSRFTPRLINWTSTPAPPRFPSPSLFHNGRGKDVEAARMAGGRSEGGIEFEVASIPKRVIDMSKPARGRDHDNTSRCLGLVAPGWTRSRPVYPSCPDCAQGVSKKDHSLFACFREKPDRGYKSAVSWQPKSQCACVVLAIWILCGSVRSYNTRGTLPCRSIAFIV